MHGEIATPSEAVRDFEARLEALAGSAAYRCYRYVRERVLEMRAAALAADGRPSAYWAEELSNIEYLLDASPLVIDKLRHHTLHLTGLRVYDYRSHRDRPRLRLVEKLRALQALAPEGLFVPEWRGLGGFGFEVDGELYNIDTLKFFEVMLALERGAVLPEFRGNSERRLVWEIGAGWGGFPYQFKTLCPNVTYVITDFPELFLFSATYLMAAFPDARVGFWGEAPPAHLFERWQEYDFLFLPHTALAELTPPRLDLTVNMVSFQEMTHEQVVAYVERAYALDCPFLYSLNRDKSSYNPEIESVSDIIARYYWPRQMSILPVPYQKMLDEKASPRDYKHVIGWRRVKV